MMLILKSTPISGINRSPAELLCNRRFCTNIPLVQHASSLSSEPTKYQTGSKALIPLYLGSYILYDKNPDNAKKRPEWTKGVVTDIDGPGRKYQIENDAGRNITRTRQDIRPDGSFITNSGSVSRPPDCLIAKM